MSASYKTVGWNANKIAYDRWLWIGIVLYLVVFIAVAKLTYNGTTPQSLMTLLIRAMATCSFLMLTLILCIGPLARINHHFLPLLYNRRHFGVSMFFIALLHAALAIFWYHSFGVENPLVSVFTSGGDYSAANDFPFQALGAMALLILFLMAATSHDYWNTNLGAPLWKALHMLVYLAYALSVVHILTGAAAQSDSSILTSFAVISLIVVCGLHILSALKFSSATHHMASSEWVDVCDWNEIENNKGVTVDIGNDERIAVFRYDEDKVCAVGNACQHQNGPLGEGCVIGGNIVCPWHGYEYRPDDGRSPPPFTEKIPTYHIQLVGNKIQVNPKALPAGTARPVTTISTGKT